MLLSSPAKAWEEIANEEESHMLSGFVYPMIALCGLAVFIGYLFGNDFDAFNVQTALTKCCGIFVSLIGGFFFSAYLIHYYETRLLNHQDNGRTNSRKLVGYSMVVTYVLGILGGLFPSFFVLQWILQFYLIYVVWEGSKVLMKIPEKKLLSYTVVSSIIILISPVIIEKIFYQLSRLAS